MKTNKLMDEIRKSTSADTNKQVDLCVAIANRVFELLQERNMKQRDFAKALGKTETEVSRWLSGTHNLTLATIAKMATVLGDDIITTTQSNRPYKLPNTQNVAMMVAEDMGSPDISRGKVFLFFIKFVPLHHEQSRTISIGTVDSAIRDTFKF